MPPSTGRARDSNQQPQAEGRAAALVQTLLSVGIDGVGPVPGAAAVAQRAMAQHGSADRAIEEVARLHVRLAAAGGFVTGVGGFLTLPVALPANVAEFYLLATRMTAAIAYLRGYELSQPEVRSAVLLLLVGADADDILRRMGIGRPGRLADVALDRLPAPAVLVINKAVGFRLVTRMGSRVLTRVDRVVPIAGGAVGAGLDWWLMRRIAAHAKREFPPTRRAIPV